MSGFCRRGCEYAICNHTADAMAQTEQDSPVPQPERIGVGEFRGNLIAFLRHASWGRSFLITSNDQVLAEVRPPPKGARLPCRPGALRGIIRMAPDSDIRPPDVLAAMEGA